MRSVAAIACILAVAACGQQAPAPAAPAPSPSQTTPTAFFFSGTVSVPADDALGTPKKGELCFGVDGYDDIAPNAQVTVSDPSGTKLAVSSLEAPVADEYGARCIFKFDMYDVPKGKPLYSVHVGNVSRGELTYTEDQLKAGIDLTIG